MTTQAGKERGRFALIAFLALAGLMVGGAFVADGFAALARPVVETLGRMIGMVAAITSDGAHGWTVPAGDAVAPTTIGVTVEVVANVKAQTLRALLRGFPLFLALMAAPPWNGRTPVRALMGLGLLLAIYCVSAIAAINFQMDVALARIAEVARTLPPGAAIYGVDHNETAAFVARFLNYVAVYVLPLLAPVLLWAWLKPEALRVLLKGDETPPPATT